MKLLPGRPQSTPQALCTGEWQRQRIVAYISGTSVVILADGVDNLVQTIYLPCRLHAVAFDEKHTGKIAVCAAGGGDNGGGGCGGVGGGSDGGVDGVDGGGGSGGGGGGGGGGDGGDGGSGDGQGAVWVYAPNVLAGQLKVCPSTACVDMAMSF